MSLISKFTSLFASSQATQGPQTPNDPHLLETLSQIMRITGKFNVRNASRSLMIYLVEKEDNIDLIFDYLSHPARSPQDIHTLQIIQLLAAIHKVYENQELQYEIAIKLKETKLEWLQQLNSEEKENFKRRNSKEIDLVADRRIDTEFVDDAPSMKPKYLATEGDATQTRQRTYFDKFAQNYHTFLQRLAANVDLYRAVSTNLYPYVQAKDYVEPKLMFLWQYKIQNIMNTALPLIQDLDLSLVGVQTLIWEHMFVFQRFLCSELQKVFDSYATLPNADSLSLYEIYQDSLKHTKILDNFVEQSKDYIILQAAPQISLPQGILQDFLGFASRLKVLNQIAFKKSIKVPNKQNPCLGIPTQNPNLRHLRSTSNQQKNQSVINKPAIQTVQYIEEAVERKEESLDQDEMQDRLKNRSFGVDLVIQEATPTRLQTKNKIVHFRGLSTFQQ